jgi:hypothetical protein
MKKGNECSGMEWDRAKVVGPPKKTRGNKRRDNRVDSGYQNAIPL